MAPQKRRRFRKPDDNLDAERAREQKSIEECARLDLDDIPDIALSTEKLRKGLMEEWNDYFGRLLEIDPDSIWLGLCLEDDIAKARCVAFLKAYVTNSGEDFPILVPLEDTGDEPQETMKRKTVTSAHSLLNIWRSLIAEADATVLLKKRREEERTRKGVWRLKFMDHTNSRGHGPVFEISKWIFKEGTAELGLHVDLLTDKIEAPAEDVIAVANVVWEHPELIPCAPDVRLSFLAELMLRGIGGFRPKALRDFKYKQVQLAVVRRQKGQSDTEIAASFRVPIVKERRTSRGKKAKWITFTVYFAPTPSICLASFVTALAIKADAFDPSIDSVKTLFQRPNLEATNYLPLKWKKEFQDRTIFRINGGTFSRMWHQACLALGLRVDPRPYVLRVGVGMDLDGVLADVLRNYIMSNTSAVFEKSYQAEHIRVNPLRFRFMPLYSDEEAWHSEALERAMRTMILKSDPNAPVRPSAKYLQSFERRRDVSTLRRKIEEAKEASQDRTMWRPDYFKLKRLIENLSRQAVVKMRTQYFERVDRLRALGQSTSEEAASGPLPASRAKHVRICYGGEALRQVARYIRLHNNIAEEKSKRPHTAYSKDRYLELLIGYLTNQPAVPKLQEEHDEEQVVLIEASSSARPSQDKRIHTCLLCLELFCKVDALTQHCRNLHVKKGTFDRPFPCPECRRCGSPDEHIITSPSSWSGHIEMYHGTNNAPNLRTDPLPAAAETQSCCPFCGLYFERGRGFHRHRTIHVRDGAASTIFSNPFPCLACRNEQRDDGKQDVIIDGYSAWNAHVSLAHADAYGDWFVQEPSDPSGAFKSNKRHTCLLCDDRRSYAQQQSLTEHYRDVHVKNGRIFERPFACPECRRIGMPDHWITSPSSWSSHIAILHGRENIPRLETVPQRPLNRTKQDFRASLAHGDAQQNQPVEVAPAAQERNEKAVCLLCGDRPQFTRRNNLTAHCKEIHVKKGRQFEKPFPCPECRRCGQPDHLIIDPSSWSNHVELAHGRANAPTLRTDPAPPKTVLLCPFCGRMSTGKHRNCHVRDGPTSSIFSTPFPCQACCNESQHGGTNDDVMIDGCAAWNAHVLSAHSEHSQAWTVGLGPVSRKREYESGGAKQDSIQCLLCDGTFPYGGIRIHFMRTHLSALASGSGSVSCFECSRRGHGEEEPASRITGIDAWNEHLESTHCDLFWQFIAGRSGFAVTGLSPSIQLHPASGRKRRKTVTPGGCSVSGLQSTAPWEQSSADLSLMDSPLSGSTLRYVTDTPESLEGAATPASGGKRCTTVLTPSDDFDMRLVDPLLLDEDKRLAMGR